MTETASQIVTLAPEYSMTKIGSAGKALFPSQLRIEKDGKQAAANEPGEIVVSGPNVTKGYFNRLDATEEAISRDGYIQGILGYLMKKAFYTCLTGVRI